MTVLILMLLVVAVIVFAVFFLFFKLIWLLLKKNTNKWPLILAGISTLLLAIAVAGTVMWGVKRVLAPFSGIIARVQTNPQPIYGSHVYTDPVYNFQLTLPDGVDFSDWMDFQDAAVKAGINTNIFKKDNAGKSIKGPVLFSVMIYQKTADADDPFKTIQDGLKENTSRQLEILKKGPVEANGKPGYEISGIGYSNRGEKIPFWTRAFFDGKGIIYVISTAFLEQDAEPAQELVNSLQVPALPAPQAVQP